MTRPRSKANPADAPPLIVISGEAFANLTPYQLAAIQRRAGQAVMAELGLDDGSVRTVRAYNMLPPTEGHRQPTIAQRLGRALRFMRTLAGHTQAVLAGLRGTTQSAIAEEEAGIIVTTPRVDTLARSAGIFGKWLLVAFADPDTECTETEPPIVAHFPSAIRVSDTILRSPPSEFTLQLVERTLQPDANWSLDYTLVGK